jgi:nickel/cobalt transporter (NiCoT) family protein
MLTSPFMLRILSRIFDDQPVDTRARITVLYAVLLAANGLAWLWALIAFRQYPVLLGTALLAYTFGLRHAVDADHIAAIDNVTRKLMQAGKRPISVGFFFALGHSTVVIVASIFVALAVSALQSRFDHFREIGGAIGTGVSAFFGMISKSWHMYPLGILFGLGFDTATEIGLLGISAAQGSQGLPLWSILIFPALFTAGMSLLDTTDGVLMVGAYGWAFVKPIRKLYYNMTITLVSVIVAVVIGGVEALGLIGNKLGLGGGFWSFIDALNENFGALGYLIIGIFLVCWLASVVVYRLKRFDDMEVLAAERR